MSKQNTIMVQYRPHRKQFEVALVNTGNFAFRSLKWCKQHLDIKIKHNWEEVKNHPEQAFYV